MPVRRHQRIRNHRHSNRHRQLSDGHRKRPFREHIQRLIQTAVADALFFKMSAHGAANHSKIQSRGRLKTEAGGVDAHGTQRIIRPGHICTAHGHGSGADAVAVNSIRFCGSVPQGKHGNCSDHAQTVSKTLSSNTIHAMGDGQNPCQPTLSGIETGPFSVFEMENPWKRPAVEVRDVTFLRQCWQSPRHLDSCTEARVCSGMGHAGRVRAILDQNTN